jgi:hypothetical protein
VHVAPLSPDAANTPRRSSRRSRGGSDDLPVVADTPVMGGRFLTPSLMRRLSSDAHEF